MWKWILRVLDQGRKNTVTDQIEFINRDAVTGDSGFNALAHTVESCLNYLLNYLLSYAQLWSILNEPAMLELSCYRGRNPKVNGDINIGVDCHM